MGLRHVENFNMMIFTERIVGLWSRFRMVQGQRSSVVTFAWEIVTLTSLLGFV
jgi:hypothetical protein